jgi:hypothetical protein
VHTTATKNEKKEKGNFNLIFHSKSSNYVLTHTGGTLDNARHPKKKRESDYCGVCSEGGELLICDGPCLQAFHLECVGLTAIPKAAKWYCNECLAEKKNKPSKEALPEADSSAKNAMNVTEMRNTTWLPNFSSTPINTTKSQSWFQPQSHFTSEGLFIPLSSQLLEFETPIESKHLATDITLRQKRFRREVRTNPFRAVAALFRLLTVFGTRFQRLFAQHT